MNKLRLNEDAKEFGRQAANTIFTIKSDISRLESELASQKKRLDIMVTAPYRSRLYVASHALNQCPQCYVNQDIISKLTTSSLDTGQFGGNAAVCKTCGYNVVEK
jgi:hypothetical protein